MAEEKAGEQGGFYDPVTDEKGYMLDYPRVHVTGKVTTDTPLQTTAQDFAGAINELFTDIAEGGDEWTYPADWPPLPEPADNQIVMLVKITQFHLDDASEQPISVMGAKNEYGYIRLDIGTMTYDYGDGTVIVYHPGESDTTRHLYSDPGYYVVTITSDDRQYHRPNDYVGSRGSGYCAIKYGASMKIDYSVNPRINTTMQYVKFCGGAVLNTLRPNEFNGWYNLGKIDFAVKPTSLPTGCFYNCYSLSDIDFATNLTAVPNNCFTNCYNIKTANLPNAVSIGDSAFDSCMGLKFVAANAATSIAYGAFYGCQSLRKVDMLSLTSTGGYAFANNYVLTDITYAQGCAWGSDAFYNDYSLYPIPT